MGALHGTAATAAATTANVSASPAVHVASPNPVSVGLGSVSNPMPISSFSMSQQQQPPPVTAIPIIPSSQPTASPMDFNFSSNSSSTSPGTDDEDDDDDVEGERSSRKRKRGSASTSTGISGGGRTRKMMDFSEVLMKQVMQKQESSSSPSSSSSSTTSSSSPYDVFLSFSEDTRKTFTDHLYWTMKDDGIDFFMEENESIRSGENISDKVKQIIEGSKVSVIVFSNRYADSIWCLEELVQIMECRRTLKQMVLPIFFDLSPSDVIGTFVLAFLKHRERFHEDTDIQERLRRWTDALTAAAGLTVRVFRTTNGYEGMFIREIIAEITVGIACPDPQRLDSPELEDVDSTERTDIGSSVSSAISPLYLAPLKEKLHEPDRSDSTSRSRKFSETRFLETREVRVRADFCPDDDGYRWRKYGQKDVLGWSYPRSYYKCAYRNTQGCGAIKQVQRDQDDPAMLIVMYRGVHVCRATNPEFAGEKGEIQKSGLEQLRSGLLQQPRRSTKRYRPLKDGPANSVGDVVPNIGSPLQAGGPILPCGDTDMLIKQRQKQQLLQHAPSNQQSQNSNLNPHQQDKMGGAGSITMDGSMSNSFRGNDQVSKNQPGRKRKQPVSSSGPANSTGTANTAGPSPSSAPSTPSTHTPGDVISMPALPHSGSSSKPLMMFGADGTGTLSSPAHQLADMDRFVEDGSLDDNVESFLSPDDVDHRDAVGRCMDVSKGFAFTEVNSIKASASKVTSCHFSSDGKFLASGGHDKKAVLWCTDTLKPKSTLEEHSALITDVRFSPSMPRLATSSFDKTVRVWDVDNPGYSLRNFMGHSASVMSLDFHPNKDDLICSCDSDGQIRYWSINNGSCSSVFKGGTAQMRFQPRLGRLLAAAAENVVSILDVETQTCRHSLQGHTKPIHSVCWDPSGEFLASVSEDSVRVWTLGAGGEGECVHELSCNGNKFHSCVFHPTYTSLLVIGCYQSLELWNMTENKTMTLSAHEGLIAALSVSTGTGLVASASHDKFVKLWK